MPVRINPEDGGSHEYVHSGAVLQCNKGTLPCQFRPTPKSVTLRGKSPATEVDKIPPINNIDFGVCLVTRSPCRAQIVLLAWQQFKKDYNIEGHHPLLDKSTINCGLGGKIKLLTSGQ